MIKTYFLLFTILILGASCSKDENSDSNSNPTPNPNNISNININLNSFQPSISPTTLFTTLENGVNNGQANRRTFYLRKDNDASIASDEYMELKITYPISTTINGTYVFINNNIPNNTMATGSFVNNTDSYIFKQGAIIVSDLGENKYKIEFENASISPFISSLQIPVTGFYEGKFF